MTTERRGLLSRLAALFGAGSAGLERKADGLSELPRLWTLPESRSGYAVGPLTALQVSTVMACVRCIAEGIAQVPMCFRKGDVEIDETADPLIGVLLYQPNPWQTLFEFIETVIFHLVLCGNAFVFVSRVGSRRQIRELIPIAPQNVQVRQLPDLTIEYRVSFVSGEQRILKADEIWHLKGASWNSWMGLDAVQLAREAIGLGIATEAAHAELHKNGARPSGLLSSTEKIAPADYKTLRDWIVANTSGENSGSPLVLDRGFSFTPFAMTGVDAQHLETRRFQIEEICRHFRVIPMMVGYSDKTATYASAEQMFIAHVVHTLTPWAVRIEQSMERHLFGLDSEIEVRFNFKGLMRGAATDRANYLSKSLGAGGSPAWMTPNEARRDDGLEPLPGGDDLPRPTNVGGAAAPVDPASADPAPADPANGDPVADPNPAKD